MKRKTITTCATLIFLAAINSQAVAQTSYLGGNSHVQLNHIMASVQPKPGSFMPGTRPLLPIMTVPKADDVAFVCQRAPRVAEAILQYFQDNPAPLLPNHHVDVERIDLSRGTIASYVNRALGRAAVSEVVVSERGPKMSKGSASRLPFARVQGCSRVLAEFEARMKKLLGGGGPAEAPKP